MTDPDGASGVRSGETHAAAAAFVRRAGRNPAVEGLFVSGSTARGEATGIRRTSSTTFTNSPITG